MSDVQPPQDEEDDREYWRQDLFGWVWHGTLAWFNNHTPWFSRWVRRRWPTAVAALRTAPFGLCLVAAVLVLVRMVGTATSGVTSFPDAQGAQDLHVGSAFPVLVGPATSGDRAGLRVEVLSLDGSDAVASVQLTVSLSADIVGDLRVFIKGEGAKSLDATNRTAWQDLPVDVSFAACGSAQTAAVNCQAVTDASVPLGQLVDAAGTAPALEPPETTISLPISGNPEQFPSDSYELTMEPSLSVPSQLELLLGGVARAKLPTEVVVQVGASLSDQTVVATTNGGQDAFSGVNVLVERSPVEALLIYLISLLPLVLGAVVWDITARRRTDDEGTGLSLVGAITAAMFAILPLRAVLVPTNLGAAGLTLVDDILVLDVFVLAGVLFLRYPGLVARSQRTKRPGGTTKHAASP